MTLTMPDSPAIDFYSSATSPKASATTTLEDLIEAIQGDEFAAKVAKLRAALAAGDDNRYAVAKKDLQAVSVSGTCDGKRANAIQEGRFTHSGFLQLDFDAVDNIGWTVDEIVHILQGESRIVAAFISPSGHGVKGIARIPVCQTKDEHAAAFAAARNHFRQHNLVIDEACKDPGRLMFVSHDPNAWIDLTRTAAFEFADMTPDLPPAPAKPEPRNGLVIKGNRYGRFPDPPQHGIHTWLMKAAWWCRLNDFTERETVERLQSHDGELRRPLQPAEATDAARSVFSTPMQNPEGKAAQTALTAEALDDLLAQAYALQFDPNSPPPPDEVVMTIEDIPIAARGNLTVLQGKSKVGKSAVISAIIGAAVRGQRRADGDTLCLNWREEASGSILHIDTEQSRSDWFQLVIRGIMRAGIPEYPPRLRSLPLIPFSRGERLTILKLALAKERDTFKKIDAVVLDGIADMCSSPNDEAEALELVGVCMALAQEYHCPIFCVLHENPGTETGKTRGHLGSELNRKAFANLRIDKDAETSISTIYGSEMRKRDIPREQGFCFGWDDEAKMHVFLARAGEIKVSVKEEKARQEAQSILPRGRSVKYADAVNHIMDALECSKRTAERRMTTYEAEGIIYKTNSGDYMLRE